MVVDRTIVATHSYQGLDENKRLNELKRHLYGVKDRLSDSNFGHGVHRLHRSVSRAKDALLEQTIYRPPIFNTAMKFNQWLFGKYGYDGFYAKAMCGLAGVQAARLVLYYATGNDPLHFTGVAHASAVQQPSNKNEVYLPIVVNGPALESTPASTSIPIPSDTPTPTATPSITPTPTPTATSLPIPTPSSTPIPTATPPSVVCPDPTSLPYFRDNPPPGLRLVGTGQMNNFPTPEPGVGPLDVGGSTIYMEDFYGRPHLAWVAPDDSGYGLYRQYMGDVGSFLTADYPTCFDPAMVGLCDRGSAPVSVIPVYSFHKDCVPVIVVPGEIQGHPVLAVTIHNSTDIHTKFFRVPSQTTFVNVGDMMRELMLCYGNGRGGAECEFYQQICCPTPTETPTSTATPSPTSTPRPTRTPRPTITRPPTETPPPEMTPTHTPRPSPTATPRPTDTPPPTSTSQPSPTPTERGDDSTPTSQPSPTPTERGDD